MTLTGETAVLGRNPVAPSDSPDAQRIAIDDVTRTVSKTHALLRLEGGSWTITDLASTNGVFVGDADDEAEVSGRAPLAGRFLLGDAELRLATDPR
ncbi:FHA domain-containing protein [Microbacterium sp. Ld4]|uniref:FHA domain-containing protein n=1 Tax=Microbacterium sp. Ld4 TaxID=649157 RepID=UPI00386896A0